MVKTQFANLARITPAFALFSCAAPKAIVVEPPPAAVKQEAAAEVPKVPAPPLADLPPDDGLRLPSMLDLPGEGEFRATSPSATLPAPGTGAVIARPPTDPPPRPKPKDGE